MCSFVLFLYKASSDHFGYKKRALNFIITAGRISFVTLDQSGPIGTSKYLKTVS